MPKFCSSVSAFWLDPEVPIFYALTSTTGAARPSFTPSTFFCIETFAKVGRKSLTSSMAHVSEAPNTNGNGGDSIQHFQPLVNQRVQRTSPSPPTSPATGGWKSALFGDFVPGPDATSGANACDLRWRDWGVHPERGLGWLTCSYCFLPFRLEVGGFRLQKFRFGGSSHRHGGRYFSGQRSKLSILSTKAFKQKTEKQQRRMSSCIFMYLRLWLRLVIVCYCTWKRSLKMLKSTAVWSPRSPKSTGAEVCTACHWCPTTSVESLTRLDDLDCTSNQNSIIVCDQSVRIGTLLQALKYWGESSRFTNMASKFRSLEMVTAEKWCFGVTSRRVEHCLIMAPDRLCLYLLIACDIIHWNPVTISWHRDLHLPCWQVMQ